MADRKTDYPEGSFLKAAVTAAPVAAGAGYSIRQAAQETKVTAKSSPITRAAEALAKIENARAKPVDPRVHIEWMNRQAKFFAGEGAALAKTAWIQAVKNADPLAQAALGSFAQTIADMPSEHVSSAITQVMAEQQSDLAQSVYRKFFRNVRVLREQEFAGGATFAFSGLKDIGFSPPAADLTLSDNLMSRVKVIEEQLGAKPGSTHIRSFGRHPWRTEGLGTHFLRFNAPGVGQFKMMLPLVNEEGILVEGITQQTRRIAPSVGIFDPVTGEMVKMSRTEFMLEEFEKSVLPDIVSGKLRSRRDVERALGELHQRVVQGLEAVPNVPAEYQTAAGRIYERLRGKAMDIMVRQERYTTEGPWRYISGFRTPTEQEMAEAMTKHGLFGGVGPTGLARGRVMLEDLSRMQLVPEAVSWARRPEAAYRQYGLTDAAREMLEGEDLQRYGRYRQYESAASRAVESQLVNPHLKAMYIDPGKYLDVMERLEMGEGEALARKGVRDFLEFNAMRTKKLAEVRDDLAKALIAGEVPDLRPGEVIGWSTEGDPVKMSKNMRLLRGIVHANDNEGTFMMLHYLDTRRIQSNDKLFGDLKAVTRLMDDKAFERFTKDIARNQRIVENADILISMDELRKDPSKHIRQMTSAMGEVLQAREHVVTKPLMQFQRDPESITNILKKLAIREGKIYEHERYIEEMMRFSIDQANVTAREFGAIFGAVPAVVGSEEKAVEIMQKAVGERYLVEHEKEMLKRLAAGVAKITYGGPAEITGVGAMGSLEPRVFEVLSGPHYADVGAEISEDFARRLAYTTPEKRAVHDTLTRVLMSMEGMAGPKAGGAVWRAGETGFEYDYKAFQAWIEKGGGWLAPGKGFSPIYVPGSETIRAMRPYETVGGLKIHGDLAQVFHGLARRADDMYQVGEAIGADEMQQEISMAARQLQKHWAPAGKGMGGWMRGKVVGSRFLRGVSRAGSVGMTELAEKSANLMVAGIPRKVAKEMFEEMATSGLWDADKLEAMRTRAMAGEEFGGMLLRHPIIGEFSAQQTRFKVIDVPGENIVIPERTVDLRVRRGGELVEKQIKLGPLVGFAGDKDADIFSAMLVSPDTEAAVRQNTLAADAEFTRRYTEHQVRYQLLKAKPPAETLLSIEEKMIADARKLGTTQRWVPKLSVELSAAKRALGAFGKGAAAADAAMLLEWLEQTPISAKHLTAAQIKSGQLEGMLAEVIHALQYGEAKGLERAVRTIVKDNAVAGQLLTGNIQIEEGAQQIADMMGGKAQREIRGINLEKTSKTLMAAMEQYKLTGEARRAEVLVGRGSGMTLREIPEVVAKHAAHMSAGVQGVFANVSRAANAAGSAIGVVGRGIIRHHKALGLGFAGSLAVAAALSSPPEQIGSGQALIPGDINLNVGKGANRMKPEDIMPPQQNMGSPTPPDMLAARRAMIAGPGASPQVSVRARAKYMINTEDLASRIGAAGGQRRSVNVNLRDNRSSINRHLAANKLL